MRKAAEKIVSLEKDTKSPVYRLAKRHLITEQAASFDENTSDAKRKMMIGDGASDLATRAVVDLFVGFGGVVARQKVKDGADAFVSINSLAPILPLAVGPAAYARLIGTPHQALYLRGVEMLSSEGVTIQSEELRAAFEQAFAAREGRFVLVRVEPIFAPLHGLPRYDELVARAFPAG